jgi:hypothetical protein
MTSLLTSSCDAPFKILLGILGYWTSSIWDLFEVGRPTRPPRGRPCQTPCSFARKPVCLYTSMKTFTKFSSFLSIKLAILPASMLGDYSTSVSSTPFCFPCRIDLLRNSFLITSLVDLLLHMFFFGPSYRTSCPPRCLDTTHE